MEKASIHVDWLNDLAAWLAENPLKLSQVALGAIDAKETAEYVAKLEAELEAVRKVADDLIAWSKAWDALNYKAFDMPADFDLARDDLIDARDEIIARATKLRAKGEVSE